MRPPVRSLAIGLAIVLGVGLDGYALVSTIVYDRMTKVPGGCPLEMADNVPGSFAVPKPDTLDTDRYLMPDPVPVEIPSRTVGITIAAWWIEGWATDPPAVIVVHGLKACRRDATVLIPAGMLHSAGYSVLLIDLRDHGESTFEDGRQAGGTDESEDVLGAWDWLTSERGLARGRVGIFGASLGASAALIAAGEEAKVAAVWADSSFADVTTVVAASLSHEGYPGAFASGSVAMAPVIAGDDLTTRSPIGAAAKLANRPVFIAHGVDDAVIDITHGEVLRDALARAGANVESWFTEGAGHTRAIFGDPDGYASRLIRFFDGALGGVERHPAAPPELRSSRAPVPTFG